MSPSSLNPRVARWLSLIAALQISTSVAYPYNHETGTPDENNAAPVAFTAVGTSGVITETNDGQVQAPYFMSTTTEPCDATSSQLISSSLTSSTPSIPTSSISDVSISSTVSSTSTTGSVLSSSSSTASINCGEPTPNVFISASGSVPYVIPDVACPQTTTGASDTSTSTLVTSSVLTTMSSSTAMSTTVSLTAVPSTTTTLPTSTVAESTSIIPDSSLMSLTTSAMQTATEPAPTSTTGSIITTLETSGQPSSLPFPTPSITTATSTLSLVNTSTMVAMTSSTTPASTVVSTTDLFQPIASDAPPAQISQTSTHPVPRLGIEPQQQKLATNKFYGNLYLGSQTAPVFTYPYSVSWSAGGGETNSWGLAISHTERSQLGIGSPKIGSDAGQWAYFINPIGIQSLVLSAAELSNGTSLTTDTLEAFSVNANLLAPGASAPTITFPLLQGMAFITGIYTDATPLIQSGIGFSTLTYAGAVSNGSTFKYRVLLNNGFTWLIYVTPSDSSYAANSFTLSNSMTVQGQSGFTGTIQVAKLPENFSSQEEALYDNSAGTYPTAAAISGTVSGSSGDYTLSWTKQGVQTQPLLTFALPHHLESFTPATAAGVTTLELITTTKGNGTAVTGDSWTLSEPQLPVSMGFAPWTPSLGELKVVSDEAISAITSAGLSELSQNVSQQSNTGTTYYDGKALAKFAAIVIALNDVADNASLALTGLQLLEEAFDFHVNNEMYWPLLYESAWGGVVESQTYVDGNSGDDFGNTYYNDHHFHYGYFVYTAAVIAYLDPSWLDRGTNQDWVNMLVRDYANPVATDPYFPFSRMFDWYHGHSWAAGLFESYDGKNQESSREDTMSLYAIKQWGAVTGDASLEAQGTLLLALQARSLQSYYLLEDDNTVEPAPFIGNKAAGIIFDNKIDHTTYFGNDPSYIEGIHMLPLLPCTALTRRPDFVSQEWAAYNWTDGLQAVQGGWRGILLGDYALVDPVTSYAFFSNATGQFNPEYLDGGASQTWYLAYSAALGGSNGTAL